MNEMNPNVNDQPKIAKIDFFGRVRMDSIPKIGDSLQFKIITNFFS